MAHSTSRNTADGSTPPDDHGLAGATGFHINVTYAASVDHAPAGFTQTIDDAVQFLESHFTDPITINIRVAFRAIDGLGESTYNLDFVKYSQIVNRLGADATSADDATAVATLPGSDPIGGRHHFYVTSALAKAWGLSGASTDLDGTSTFSKANNLFDYDRSDGIDPGKYDFFGSVIHEFTEVMGREMLTGRGNQVQTGPNNGYYPLDLFHYSGPGERSFVGTEAGYFSVDGETMLYAFNTKRSGDWGDWASSVKKDSFLAFSNDGVVNKVSETDLRQMDILGYDRTGAALAAYDTADARDFGSDFGRALFHHVDDLFALL